jgi:rod shape-determining protein MreB
VKCKIGSAVSLEKEITMTVKGRDLVVGIPKSIEITSVEIREALSEPLNSIVEAVKLTLEKTPPELSADIRDRGIILAGGGAMLKGLDQLLRDETNLPINLADDPMTCVVRGSCMVLDNLEEYEGLLLRN